MRTILLAMIFGGVIAFASGCNRASDAGHADASKMPVDGAKYMLEKEPDDAIGVIEARASARHGQPITVVGRIGGTSTPWVNGRAAFTLLDASMVLVDEGIDTREGQICTGDCCAAERAKATLLVKILGENGRVLEVDSRHLLNVAENEMAVICGKVTRDESGNVALIADKLFIRR